MADWLQLAKDNIYVDPEDGVTEDKIVAVALIAIAEELRKLNLPKIEPAITVHVDPAMTPEERVQFRDRMEAAVRSMSQGRRL